MINFIHGNRKKSCEQYDSPNIFMSIDTVTEDQLIANRRLSIAGPIDESTSLYINSYLRYFNTSNKPVYLYIASPGGDTCSGYSIVDQMQISQFPVHTIVCGHACSMAAIIAAYGEPGHRYITENSMMMMHPFMIGGPMQSVNIQESQQKFMNKDYHDKVKKLAKKIGAEYHILLEKIDKTCFLTAEESIQTQFVDKVWLKENEKVINDCEKDKKKKDN